MSILLLGIDSWESTGRADTIVVVTLNPSMGSMKLLSIRRDTYTEIIGLNVYDKINHSYVFGGANMSVRTVENLLQIPIYYVVAINMEGFRELVDILDGIKVNNEYSFSTDDFHFEAGQLTLTGEQALEYVRMRKDDSQGDFGRQNRQRQGIESLIKELFLKYALANTFHFRNCLGNVETNILFDKVIQLSSKYKNTLNNINHLSFHEGQGMIKDNFWYYSLNEKELTEIQNQLQNFLKVKNKKKVCNSF